MTERKLWFNILLVLFISGLITFSHLGSLSLFDPDEPVYAETAREMIQFQDFISPRIYGEFWYDKPPMYYWLVAGAFKMFGVGEFAARFPSAFLAVIGVAVVYLSGRKLFSDRAALLSALILTTSLEYFYLSNAAVTDMTLTFFMTAALLSFLHRHYYMFYGWTALAVVTKGPIGVVFCGGIVGLYLLFTGNLGLLKRMKIVRGTALFAVIALPWYLMMYHYHGMAFVDTFLGFHNVTRFLQPEHSSGILWYYYIPVLIVGFFPWTPFLVQAFFAALRENGQNRNYGIFLVIWASVVFLFFTLSQTKLVSYILPMYPPLALLVGWYFDKAWREKDYRVLKWFAAIFTMLVIILELGLFYAGKLVTSQLFFSVQVLAGMFVLVLAFVWWMSYRQNFRGAFCVNVIGMLAFITILMAQIFPAVVPIFSTKGFVNEFKQHYDGKTPVYIADFYRPSFMFYSDLPSNQIKLPETLPVILDKPGKAYFIVKKKEYEKLSPALQSKVRVLAIQEDKILFVREFD
ncbi:MAG: hypothetical protein H6Q68_2527 [Firmicutes bacterium]|nr:hypothetical protein [Bacillota bacterium]